MRTPMLLMAALAAAPVLADEFEQAPTPLDPLLVTATRAEQFQSDLVASATVISREDIERAHANDLADLLRTVAGVDVARNGGPGSPASVFIRGGESNHTLFLVDGVRYTTESFLNAQIQNLAPEMIERIEIVKGPRSGLWGSDALGGVVHIITRRAGEGLHGGMALRTGHYGARNVSGSVSAASTAGSLQLQAQSQSFDGFPAMRSGGVDRGHDNLSVGLRGELELGKATLGVRHLDARGTNEYLLFGEPRSQDFNNRVTAAELAATPVGGWHSRATVSLAHDELVQREPSDPARPQLLDYADIRRKSAEWENRVELAGLALVGGLSTSRSEIDVAFHSEFGDSFIQGRSDQRAVFARVGLERGPIDAAVSARHARHSRFGGFTTGDLALGWRVGSTRLGLTGGTGYKEPELTDLYGDFGNPDLVPERSASIEGNVRQTLGTSQVLTAAVFQTIVSELIVFDLDTFKPQNVERARIRGLEIGWRLSDGGWDLGVSGSMQNPVNETNNTRLLRRSRRSAQAHAGHHFGRWSAQVDLQAHGERMDTDDARLGGYALVGAGASVELLSGWRLSVRGENLLDTDYELIQDFRTPGRSGSVELRASF